MKHLRTILFFLFILLQVSLLAQKSGIKAPIQDFPLTDSILNRELAVFTVRGGVTSGQDTLARAVLTEIPILQCTGEEVYFSWSTFTSSVSTFIHLYFKNGPAGKELDSIFLVTHSHFMVKIPDSAFRNIQPMHTCEFKSSKKVKKYFSPYYKAFYSADKRRLYIYMQGESDTGKYEVTWIFVDDRYYKRLRDRLP